MSNLFDALGQSTAFNKFKVDDLLFVEYTCEPGGPRAEIWSHNNYFTYVVSGKMTLKAYVLGIKISTIEYNYFEDIKNGTGIVRQKFTEDNGNYFTIEIKKQ